MKIKGPKKSKRKQVIRRNQGSLQNESKLSHKVSIYENNFHRAKIRAVIKYMHVASLEFN